MSPRVAAAVALGCGLIAVGVAFVLPGRARAEAPLDPSTAEDYGSLENDSLSIRYATSEPRIQVIERTLRNESENRRTDRAGSPSASSDSLASGSPGSPSAESHSAKSDSAESDTVVSQSAESDSPQRHSAPGHSAPEDSAPGDSSNRAEALGASLPGPLTITISELSARDSTGRGLHWSVPTSSVADDASQVVEYQGDCPDAQCLVRVRFRVPESGFEIGLGFEIVGPEATAALASLAADVQLQGGPAFGARPWPGFGQLAEQTSPARVSGDGVSLEPLSLPERFEGGHWLGIRNRFHTLLVQGGAGDELREIDWEARRLRVSMGAGRDSDLRIYAGPLSASALATSDPELGSLRFASLSTPIRWLTLVFDALLGLLVRLSGSSVGWAIVMLSLCVKVIGIPIAALAEHWQSQVNRQRAWLEPRLAAIRQQHRGERRSREVLALHRSSGISPLYGLKSLGAVAIQLPFFLAAYHLLDESSYLEGARFLWITDLARPDALPFSSLAETFVGAHLHLLPLVMTVAACISARLHSPPNISAKERLRQRRGMYAASGCFLVLLYTFPAGMVLYWTTNNFIALARSSIEAWWTRGTRTLEAPHVPCP